MARGYRRVALEYCGAGAAEVWSAVLDGELPDRPESVGVVRQVYDRSAYLEFDPAAIGSVPILGPPLVLLAGDGFDGPLVTRLRGDRPGGFRPDGLTVGADCRLRSDTARSDRPRAVLAIGGSVEIEVDPGAVDAWLPREPRGVAPRNPRLDPALLRDRADLAIERLRDADHEDGLDWLDEIAGLAGGESLTGERAALVDWWASYLADDRSDPDPPLEVLGRGPGATPSGDDVLSGLLLALDRLTAGRQHQRVQAAGERVVEAAIERTTTVSAALLAQAVQGRAADRVAAAVDYLLAQEPTNGAEASSVLAAAEVGHTSGVDLLVGVLLVSLGIAPRLAADNEAR